MFYLLSPLASLIVRADPRWYCIYKENKLQAVKAKKNFVVFFFQRTVYVAHCAFQRSLAGCVPTYTDVPTDRACRCSCNRALLHFYCSRPMVDTAKNADSSLLTLIIVAGGNNTIDWLGFFIRTVDTLRRCRPKLTLRYALHSFSVSMPSLSASYCRSETAKTNKQTKKKGKKNNNNNNNGNTIINKIEVAKLTYA